MTRKTEEPARPYVARQDMEAAYHEMAGDEERGRGAHEWSEGVIGDVTGDQSDAAR